MNLTLPLEYIIQEPLESSSKEPLLFFLVHGYGSNEKDLFSFATDLPKNAYVISFRAPHTLQYESYYWYQINLSGGNKIYEKEEAKKSLDLITESIGLAKKALQIPAHRCFLIGFSQGSILGFSLAMNHPEKLHHIAALSGYWAYDIVGKPSTEPSVYEKLSFYISHGKMDPVIPVSLSEIAPAELEKLGAEYKYKTYAAGHNLDRQNYDDFLSWIDQRINHLTFANK